MRSRRLKRVLRRAGSSSRRAREHDGPWSPRHPSSRPRLGHPRKTGQSTFWPLNTCRQGPASGGQVEGLY